MKQSKLRRCSKCGKQFSSDLGISNHIRDKHKGDAERVPVQKNRVQLYPKYEEPSIASRLIDAQLDYAMGEPVDDDLMGMFGDEITGV